MDQNKRGFTLIELLAVIVILAIIALIAVPVIMNVITKARVSAFEDSAYGIVKAGELYYSNQLLEPEGMTGDKEFIISNGAFEGDVLDVSGSLPSSGKVTVTSEGKVALAISNGEYCIRKATTESSVKAEPLEDLGGVCNYKTVFTETPDGTEVPACITNNTECSAGTKVGVQVNASKNYVFYVMEDNTSKNEITLLMSGNLGETVVWINTKDYLEAGGEDLSHDGGECEFGGMCSKNDKGPITALNYLESETSGWTNIPAKTYQVEDENNSYSPITRTARARLITYSEASALLSLENNGWVYEVSSYASNSGMGYWMSSTGSFAKSACSIDYSGGYDCGKNLYIFDTNLGVRPVITVSKSVL